MIALMQIDCHINNMGCSASLSSSASASSASSASYQKHVSKMPHIALLGIEQCGKSTMIQQLARYAAGTDSRASVPWLDDITGSKQLWRQEIYDTMMSSMAR